MREWVTAKARINGLDRSTNRILEQISNKTLKEKKNTGERGYWRKVLSFDRKKKLRTRNVLDFFYKHVGTKSTIYFLYRLQLCNFKILLINKYFLSNEKIKNKCKFVSETYEIPAYFYLFIIIFL